MAPEAALLSPGTDKSRVAVVLFNLGGPDRPESVKPFLLNLFLDPAILRVPFFVRPILARIIARARVKPASENYALLGGKSPLLELTQAQATALEADLPDLSARCFVAMRYWHPFSDEVARAVRDWQPEHVVLLPLYPQYSTTTAGSSLTAWREAAARIGLVAPVSVVCCYHSEPNYVAATAAIIRSHYDRVRAELDPAVKLRVLFSAHGLPEVIINAGDPYQYQVEQTVAAVIRELDIPELDSVICYQSRATPQKWISPSTEEVIEEAAADKVAVLVVPIAFVSEHSETLVELDIEYRDLAESLGVPAYYRVPTQNADPAFITALAEIVRNSIAKGPGLCNTNAGTACANRNSACPYRRVVADV